MSSPAPAFWNKHFPGGGGQPDWDKASDALMRECDRMGVFQPGRVRGRGAWLDEDGEFVIHLGDRLLAPGEKRYRAPDRYTAEQKIYPRAQSLAGPSTERVLTVEESRHILQLFVDLRWTHPAAGYLLAGWTALAPFCGALPRRPHILLTGASPSGKTTIVRRMIIPLLGEMLMAVDCGSNEAGIRQYMGADALPVIYDHADSHHVYPVLGWPVERLSMVRGSAIANATARRRGTTRAGQCSCSPPPEIAVCGRQTRLTFPSCA